MGICTARKTAPSTSRESLDRVGPHGDTGGIDVTLEQVFELSAG